MDKEELKRLIIIACNNALIELDKYLTNDIRATLDRYIYNKKESPYYLNRTRQTRELAAQSKLVGKKIKIDIINEGKIIGNNMSNKAKSDGKWYFNQHMDIYGKDDSDLIPIWWDAGTKNAHLPEVPKTEFWSGLWHGAKHDKISKKFQDLFVKEMNKILKGRR